MGQRNIGTATVRFFIRPHIGVGIVTFRGALLSPNNLGILPELEWNLAVCLTLRPMFEYGIDVVLAKVIVLLEGYILRQILGLDIVDLGALQFLPGDFFLSFTDRYA